MSRTLTRLGFTAIAIIAGAMPAMAQGTQTGSMTITVVNSKGAAIAGAEVRLTSPSLQGERVVRADEKGRASARLLPPGQYRILVRKDGFTTVTLNEHLGLEQNYMPRVVLAKEAETVVEVLASEQGAEKTESKTAFNYTKDRLDTLPIIMNSALDAVYLSPGVAKSIMSDKGGIEIRGAQGTGSLTLVDGQNTMDNTYVGQRLKINMDDVEETQVLTGAIPAEYGFIEGGVVNSITKSGGNEFTGNLRTNLANQDWNAVTPITDRSAILKHTTIEKSISIGGPIIKDMLWFYASYFNSAPSTPQSLDGSVAGLPIVNYSETHGDYRREMKLTFSPIQNQTFTLSYHNFIDAWNRNASGAGELGALSMFNMTGEFYSLSWRATFGDNIAWSAKIGTKKQSYGTTANGQAWGPPIFNQADYNTYASGAWDPADPMPDQRDNKTLNLKLTYFFNAGGSHELDLGYDYYEGITKSSGFQSAYYADIPGVGHANIATFSVDQWDGVNRVGTYLTPDNGGGGAQAGYPFSNTGNGLCVEIYVPDTNTMKLNSFYFNDKYILNNHWNFNIGGRFDTYQDSNLSAGKIGSGNGFSPRLGAKYDINGDGAWVLGLAYSRLLGRPLETTFQAGGYVFHPLTYGFTSLLAAQATNEAGNKTFTAAQIYDLNNYDLAHPQILDSVFNVLVDPHLKMTTVDEMQASIAYTFHNAPLGSGYVRANLVQKVWNNLVAERIGMDGTVTNEIYGTQYLQYYYNEPQAHRSYKALELDASTTINHVHLAANATWSETYGNYNSDAGTSYPGQIPIYYTYANGANESTPYDPRQFGGLNGLMQGRLSSAAPRSGGMSPTQYNLIGDYYLETFLGRTTFGIVYQFRSGLPYDLSRTVSDLGQTQVLGAPGAGVYGSSSLTNVAVTQDFKLWKAKNGQSVNAWVRLGITNIWNHQQVLSWTSSFTTVDSAHLNDPWTPKNANFGQPTGISDYATPRNINLSIGIKF